MLSSFPLFAREKKAILRSKSSHVRVLAQDLARMKVVLKERLEIVKESTLVGPVNLQGGIPKITKSS